MPRSVVIIAHNIRSAHNVGSILRTAAGLGIDHVYLTGYSPFPLNKEDTRLPHLAKKIDKQIDKTALGAARQVPWSSGPDIGIILSKLKNDRYLLAALENSVSATDLRKYKAPKKLALILGSEVEGVDQQLLDAASVHLKIAMAKKNQSFNVSVAAAIAMFYLTQF